jgi:pyruvate kinase
MADRCEFFIISSEGNGIELIVYWIGQVDNRIRYGIAKAFELKILQEGTSIIAIQGWGSGSNKTNTLRILTVPAKDQSGALELQQTK